MIFEIKYCSGTESDEYSLPIDILEQWKIDDTHRFYGWHMITGKDPKNFLKDEFTIAIWRIKYKPITHDLH